MVAPSTLNKQRRRLIRRIFLACMLGFSGILLISTQGGELQDNPLRSISEDVLIRGVSVVNVPVSGVKNMARYWRSKQQLLKENDYLRTQLALFQDISLQVDVMREQISAYEKFLNPKSSIISGQKPVIARVMSETSGPFVHSVLINAGKKQGLKSGYAVLASEGLFGHIIRVGDVSARVLKLTDLNSRVPVMSARSRGVAILGGDNSTYPKLLYSAKNDDWRVGDKVLTSGDDGVLLRGIDVGEVIQDSNDGFKVKLKSAHYPSDWVMVLEHRKILPPDEPGTEIP